MKNLVQDGLIVPVTAPGNVDSGDLVKVGSLIGVAVGAAESGNPLQLRLEGVFDGLPKKVGDTFAAGTLVYYDLDDDVLTTAADDGDAEDPVAFPKVGIALSATLVRLNGAF